MKKVVEIPENAFANSIYNSCAWQESVVVKQYVHDYVKKIWIVEYMEK